MAAMGAPQPVNQGERSHNPLRPTRLHEMIGQDRAKRLIGRALRMALRRDRTLDHLLLVGPSGVGKSTVAHVIAEELGVDCFQAQAPISRDTLLELRSVMRHQDVLFLDEIHQQAIMERRGKTADTQPEVLYNVMEDRTIVTRVGVLPFPEVCVIGATTDEGALPDAFVNRFPLRPILEHYTPQELARIAKANGDALNIELTWEAAAIFARASRGVPRQINNYVRNGVMLAERINAEVAEDVLRLNRVTDDGLTLDMQRALAWIFRHGARVNQATGTTVYQASVGSIATAIGKSRDAKAVQLRVEPYLIERGFLQVAHGGRTLTNAGVRRAQELARSGVK